MAAAGSPGGRGVETADHHPWPAWSSTKRHLCRQAPVSLFPSSVAWGRVIRTIGPVGAGPGRDGNQRRGRDGRPSLPDRPDGGSSVRSATPAASRRPRWRRGAVTGLAAHWAALASPIHPSRPGLAVRLAALLRRLAAAGEDEQFWALRARVLGGEQLRSGLCGEVRSTPSRRGRAARHAGAARDRLPQVFGLPGAARSGSRCWTRWRRATPALRDRVRREQEEDLRRRVAETAQDALTLLPHRAIGEQRLRRAFASSAAVYLGLCSLDLDGFGSVNDTLGHDLGDRLLVEVATRLHQVAAPNLVAGTGGRRVRGARRVRRRPPRRREPGPTHPEAFDPALPGGRGGGGDLGECRRRGGGPGHRCPRDLLRAADVALSWAKAQGGGRVAVFDPDRDAGESARAALLAGMPDGVERGEFLLHYQPLVRLADGRVQGAEALVRWQHPEHGLLGPGRFVEAAEAAGPSCRWAAGSSPRLRRPPPGGASWAPRRRT